jgi:type II secretory pathway component PulL
MMESSPTTVMRASTETVEVSIMGHDRPRWRFRLSILMLLVVIAALATYIVVERWQRAQEARRLAAEAERAFRQLEAQTQRAQAQADRAKNRARTFPYR